MFAQFITNGAGYSPLPPLTSPVLF